MVSSTVKTAIRRNDLFLKISLISDLASTSTFSKDFPLFLILFVEQFHKVGKKIYNHCFLNEK